ncbi:MAG: branched-chain amino acid aminotransferase [SAR202 cluster bacterium]|nr:branched-chain amino acid aminotransferase [SAR202 cluster bacterium]
MADYISYCNGEWMPYSKIKIEPGDRGFTIGDVVYDVERTFNGKGFKLEEHIDRLYRSLKFARIDAGVSRDEMLRITQDVIKKNEHLRKDVGDFAIMQFVTRGPGYFAWKSGPATVCVKISPVDFKLFAPGYTTGMKGAFARTRALPSDVLDSKVKHFSRMHFAMAELEANDTDPGAWPLILDTDGNLTEGSRYNVFIVTDGVIRTGGDKNLLQGVSRGTVFELARQLNIPAVSEDLQPYDVYTADEVFFASTSYCVLPVTSVDRRPVGTGKPGKIVNQLLAAWSEKVGVDIVGQAQDWAKK